MSAQTPKEPECVKYLREVTESYRVKQQRIPIPNEFDEALAAFMEHHDELRAERDAAVRELEETRKREALSDVIVDECDSDITKLVQERATLRARLAACEKIVEAADIFFDATDDREWEERAKLFVLVANYRAAVAAETHPTAEDTTP